MTKMCNDLTDDRKAEIAFNTAVEARKLELQLFWKRSLFFWGFIAVTFAAYGKLHEDSSNLSVIAACFGLVCSVAWSLSNRGSKFWYESWEKNVTDIEKRVTGKIMFAGPRPVDSGTKAGWRGGTRFSVSKLAIALSDYTVVICLFLIGLEVYGMCANSICPYQASPANNVLAGVCIGSSVVYCVLMFSCSNSSHKN